MKLDAEALQVQLERCLSGFANIRKALGLHRDSENNLLDEIAQLKAENAALWALAKFGRWSLGFHLEGYHEKYSSYDRDAAFDLGILEEVRVEKPCSYHCQCKFYDNVFPRNCVRETPLAQLPEKRE